MKFGVVVFPGTWSDGDCYHAITDVLGHLRGLDGGERDRAERYIRRAPEQIRTPYRDAIQRELGWTFVGTGAE